MENVFYRPDSLRSLMVEGDKGDDDQDDKKREGVLRKGKEENRKQKVKREEKKKIVALPVRFSDSGQRKLLRQNVYHV